MKRSGWWVAALAVVFLIIQSCGDELAVGYISTPGGGGGGSWSERAVSGRGVGGDITWSVVGTNRARSVIVCGSPRDCSGCVIIPGRESRRFSLH